MAWNDGLLENTPAHTLASSTEKTIRAVAGPGSGKSFAIKRRVARLLEEGINPDEILAITFTRTAAQDVKREISSLGIAGADQVHSRTIHSHALKILMQTEVLAVTGRVPRMVIDHEITPALKDLNDESFGDQAQKRNLKNQYLAAWADLQTDRPGFVKDAVQGNFENQLVNWLKKHKAILVGEVMPVAIEYLRNNPASAEIGKYHTILVDEYQDLNRSEQEFIRLIRGNANIVIVGDDDQSIYGFKFAHPEGIRDIQILHGDYEDIVFAECRRCPKQVTLMASELIQKNPNRTLGALIPHSNNHDGIVQVVQWTNYNEEIEGITRIISTEIGKGTLKPEDVLILTPRRRIGYAIKNRLLTNGVPAKSYFRESFIDNDSVKRAYSLLAFLVKPDDLISTRFLLGAGSQDYRRNQYEKLLAYSEQQNTSITDVLTELTNGRIKIAGVTTIVNEYQKVLADVNALKLQIIASPVEAFQTFFIKTEQDEDDFYELNQFYVNAAQETQEEDLSTEEGFARWINSFYNCFVEQVVMPEIPENIDHVRIMSLHSSKGLSAKLVVLMSMIDNLMPYTNGNLSDAEMSATIEEQRRLFYVALTRCKAGDDYPGRLLVSSFLSINGIEALRLGIKANSRADLRTRSTRFLNDFGQTSPQPVRGDTLN